MAAIAIPRLTGAQERARTSTHNANIAVAENGAPGKSITWDSVSNTTTDPAGFESSKYLDTWPKVAWTGATDYTVTIDADGNVTVDGGDKP